MKDVKWLLAGAGDIAKSRVAAALSDAKNSSIAAIYGRSHGNAEALAEKYSIPLVFHDFDQALTESGADAVYIATPHHCHVPMAKAALKAGKHFLSEKPLGIDSLECLSLLEEAQKHPHLVTSCSNYRLFSNQFLTTLSKVRDGSLGELIGGFAHDEEPYYNPSNAPLLMKDGMSPVLGFGFYLINLAQTLFGLPEEVFAMTSSFNCAKKDPFDIDDVEHILLRFKNGKIFSIYLNMASQSYIRHTYEFAFEYGRIEWPMCPPHYNKPINIVSGWKTTLDPSSVTQPLEEQEKPNWHLPMIEDFVSAIQNRAQPLCTLESAVRTSQITEAILKSARLHSPIKMEY